MGSAGGLSGVGFLKRRNMEKLKRNLGRYMGIGLAALLVFTAIYLPRIWFALRDAASLGRIQGEVLAPLMVAQLDRSYERDIYKRMRAYMEAYAQGDVNCSSKEIDPGDESLRANMEQMDNCVLMDILRGWSYVTESPMKGLETVIESCSQYVLMRRSDGQILLVANDIRLDKGDGCHMELLIDGVDGTVYFLESEENKTTYPLLPQWFDVPYAWEWWRVLSDTYYTEEKKNAEELELYIQERERSALEAETDVNSAAYVEINAYRGDLDDYSSDTWAVSEGITDIYCCLLNVGEERYSWTMEIDKQKREDFFYQIRLGLPGVVNSIPGMAGRISLAEYAQVRDMAGTVNGDQ